MKTPNRTPETPYAAVDPLTQDYLGWYDTYTGAVADTRGRAFVYYRPGKKKAVKK